ncbi:MAG: thioredoxin domain-containing protein [Xanthobacteraceae bacterium]|nr:thioredoxin domain-containing protein [Xanthobacteraceae bacterium]MCW5673218.1 thioredoxin domain-containing protein [Xanthobacteraceae bacterium]
MSENSLAQNRLANETSPYLIQHKDNPVHWWPWSPEAFAEARRANKPVLLSIGYAACHWCHVMAHESFEDAATAAVMNDLFVNIKVDREERPEVDEIYMSALQHLGEQGGWPLTMFLDADGKPFWGGTYFPKTAQYGRPGFTDVLRELSRIYREEPEKVGKNRDALIAALRQKARPAGKVTIGVEELNQLANQFLNLLDMEKGGIRGAPKFPQSAILEMLWRAGERTGSESFFDAVLVALRNMCEGGIYDHLGGGFARYSVDDRWLVPHFEKMLYDNAQLLELLALAWKKTGDDLFRRRAHETVEWLTREMIVEGGGFASSLDADSEGEEGKFYVWSLDEVARVLGADDAAFFAKAYDLTRDGNFEGHNIPNRLLSGSASAEDEVRLAPLRAKLLDARAERVRPGLDDKVLADWNGLMCAALANAGALFSEAAWIELGARAFRFVSDSMTKNSRLGHSWRAGGLLFPGLSSDYGSMIRAALALHRATGEKKYLDRAIKWEHLLEAHHANPETGGYFLTADDGGELILRPHSTRDDAIPNPHAWMAQNLARLAALTGQYSYTEKADRLFEGVLPLAAANLFGHAALLAALDTRLRLNEIVVTGARAGEFAKAALAQSFLASTLLRAPDESALPAGHPAREKLAAVSGEGAAFVCRGQVCSLPIADPAKLADALAN